MPRIVRIAAIAQGDWGGPTIEANRRRMAGLIELALADKPDIIALPESFTLADLAEPRIEEMAEDVPGPTLEMASAYAHANRVYILCPILARRADGLHIEAFLLDRAGQIAGSYQKNHPVVEGCGFTKLEFGSQPGRGAPAVGVEGAAYVFCNFFRSEWTFRIEFAAGGQRGHRPEHHRRVRGIRLQRHV